MDHSYAALLTLTVFLPTLGALVLALFFPKDRPEGMRWFALSVTGLVFLLTVLLAWPNSGSGSGTGFAVGKAEMQQMFSIPWISSFNIFYFMGSDGISLPLVLLTSFLSILAIGASWPIAKATKAYLVLFLLLETGMLGVFLSLDFFLFYVFWEVMLLPMYFLIGVWGGPRREYAAIKFFLYTLLGSVLMLIAILMLYFNSDLRLLSAKQLQEAKVAASEAEAQKIIVRPTAQHTFNILALTQMGQLPKSPFSGGPKLDKNGAEIPGTYEARELLFGRNLQWWAFVLLFIGFAIKVPAVPVHTWLPDAHVEAPTPISMILAGVLLKMGGYGIIRICYPICPDAGYDLAYVVCGIGALSMVYGAFAAMAQKDFKRLVAYSSVSHMGYVVLGIGVWSATERHLWDPSYWAWGMNGAMFQMIAHGISSAGMFFLVGVIYDRVHHRNLDQFGGLFGKMPLYTAFAIGIFFAGLGLPGLCGFIGEAMVTLGVWTFSHALAVISASVVILTAGYILWTIQRVYLGAEYKGPHGDHLHEMTGREIAIAVPLLCLAIAFGVYPQVVFNYMEPSVTGSVKQLADWTKNVKDAGGAKSATAGDPPAPVATPVGFQQPKQNQIDASQLPTAVNDSQATVTDPQTAVTDPHKKPSL